MSETNDAASIGCSFDAVTAKNKKTDKMVMKTKSEIATQRTGLGERHKLFLTSSTCSSFPGKEVGGCRSMLGQVVGWQWACKMEECPQVFLKRNRRGAPIAEIAAKNRKRRSTFHIGKKEAQRRTFLRSLFPSFKKRIIWKGSAYKQVSIRNTDNGGGWLASDIWQARRWRRILSRVAFCWGAHSQPIKTKLEKGFDEKRGRKIEWIYSESQR